MTLSQLEINEIWATKIEMITDILLEKQKFYLKITE